GADDASAINAQAVQQVIRAATLERADRVHGLDLQQCGDADAAAERLANELRGVEKNGVDNLGGLTDAVDGDRGVHVWEDKGSCISPPGRDRCAVRADLPQGGEVKVKAELATRVGMREV